MGDGSSVISTGVSVAAGCKLVVVVAEPNIDLFAPESTPAPLGVHGTVALARAARSRLETLHSNKTWVAPKERQAD